MKIKLISTLTVFAILIGLLTACGGNTTSAPAAQVVELDTSYANALDTRSQLLLGTIRLAEGTGPALNKEQATKLLLLWGASKSLSTSGTASQAELDSIISQIQAVMTNEQLQAIKEMHLVQTDMQTFNQSIGMTTSGTESGSGVPGQGKTLSPEARATNQALRGNTGGSGAITYLLKVLEDKAGN